MKRIFIDSDIVQKDELNSAKREVFYALQDAGKEPENKDVFDQVVGRAWHDAEQAWEAVKSANEIYASTSLVPLCGYGTYTGSVVVFDVMMQKAIDEKITGKSIFFLRSYNDIEWIGIDLKLMPKAFKQNKLFTREYDEEYNSKFVEVDIKKLIRQFKNR